MSTEKLEKAESEVELDPQYELSPEEEKKLLRRIDLWFLPYVSLCVPIRTRLLPNSLFFCGKTGYTCLVRFSLVYGTCLMGYSRLYGSRKHRASTARRPGERSETYRKSSESLSLYVTHLGLTFLSSTLSLYL